MSLHVRATPRRGACKLISAPSVPAALPALSAPANRTGHPAILALSVGPQLLPLHQYHPLRQPYQEHSSACRVRTRQLIAQPFRRYEADATLCAWRAWQHVSPHAPGRFSACSVEPPNLAAGQGRFAVAGGPCPIPGHSPNVAWRPKRHSDGESRWGVRRRKSVLCADVSCARICPATSSNSRADTAGITK
jgi:hypothetical protein